MVKGGEGRQLETSVIMSTIKINNKRIFVIIKEKENLSSIQAMWE